MSIITPITNHEEQAFNRLISQYKESSNLKSLISVYTDQIQSLEDQINKLVTERTLDGSVGFQLDQLGTILNVLRNGLSDDDYRTRLKAKIAENNSQGTPEDLISIFKLLLNPEDIRYNEVYPAGFELTAIGQIDPISSIDEVRNAIDRAKSAGTELVAIKQVINIPEFSFAEDPDPTGGGFRDINVLDPIDGLIETDTSLTLNPTAGFLSDVV